MKLVDIMAAYKHRPFRPLILRTDSGQEYPVSHPEALSTSQDGEIVGLILPDHDFVLIDVEAIREIVARPSRARKPPSEERRP